MHVTKIELSDRYLHPVNRSDCARVSFFADGFITQVEAQAPRAAPQPDLIRDAIRQLKRMPEFRSGQDNLSFHPDCTVH